VALAGQAAAQVTFYARARFQVESFTTRRQVSDFARFGFNDGASSVEVFGAHWNICRNGRFVGPCVVLREGRYRSLAAMGLDNQVSLARIVGRDMRQVDNHASTVPPAPVYKNPRRRGNERFFDAQVTSVRAVVQTPEKRYWVEPEQVSNDSRNKIPGAIIGAVIGGILGHQVGAGRVRDLATSAEPLPAAPSVHRSAEVKQRRNRMFSVVRQRRRKPAPNCGM
jgi:hypothetical protein